MLLDMTSNIRLSQPVDLQIIMEIYANARDFMNRTGNVKQWVNGYPSVSYIEEEINKGHSFVIENNNGEIVGTFCFIIGDEPTYNKIYKGNWLNNKEYGTVHRVASSGKEKGVGEACFKWCFRQFPNIRVDTHRDNKVMQNILAKLDFKYCGIIYVQDGSERLAYQKET